MWLWMMACVREVVQNSVFHGAVQRESTSHYPPAAVPGCSEWSGSQFAERLGELNRRRTWGDSELSGESSVDNCSVQGGELPAQRL
jgi:hypothetical protein